MNPDSEEETTKVTKGTKIDEPIGLHTWHEKAGLTGPAGIGLSWNFVFLVVGILISKMNRTCAAFAKSEAHPRFI